MNYEKREERGGKRLLHFGVTSFEGCACHVLKESGHAVSTLESAKERGRTSGGERSPSGSIFRENSHKTRYVQFSHFSC